jgi:hypothetical protein
MCIGLGFFVVKNQCRTPVYLVKGITFVISRKKTYPRFHRKFELVLSGLDF